MRIRPLVSRSRSRRRRARASHRRSRRSRRHRRRHHRSGMSHTITPSAHRRSLSRNHPPRPSSTVARIVISHHESTMTMRGGANETRVRSRLRVPLSLSLSRVVDRSFDRVSMPPFASRPSRTPVLARARQSHPITCNSFITRARRAVLAGIDRLDGPARAPFHIHTQTPIDRSNKKKQSRNTRTTKNKQRTGQVAPSPRAPPRGCEKSGTFSIWGFLIHPTKNFRHFPIPLKQWDESDFFENRTPRRDARDERAQTARVRRKTFFRSFHQVSSQTDEWRLRERDEADAWRSARRVRLERGCACDDALGKNGV